MVRILCLCSFLFCPSCRHSSNFSTIGRLIHRRRTVELLALALHRSILVSCRKFRHHVKQVTAERLRILNLAFLTISRFLLSSRVCSPHPLRHSMHDRSWNRTLNLPTISLYLLESCAWSTSRSNGSEISRISNRHRAYTITCRPQLRSSTLSCHSMNPPLIARFSHFFLTLPSSLRFSAKMRATIWYARHACTSTEFFHFHMACFFLTMSSSHDLRHST
mmetsp:Transcript_3000/g.7275  ORF Transcript_3000/g.7275 Transcript_3000/m.7275 type:complete len:220 (-) Transcript_3000:1123-1782(-)